MTYVVGLTGGIGSGKSTVAEFFAEFGVPIIDADILSRTLLSDQPNLLSQIAARFGNKILQKNGQLNRSLLRDIIFHQPEDKKWLEQLLHPLIHQAIVEAIKKINYPYCIVVIPLLAEQYSLYQDLIDHILVIDASQEQQLAWTVKRDNCSEALIQKMIASQASREQRAKIANTLLKNNQLITTLKNKVKSLHQAFLAQAAKTP